MDDIQKKKFMIEFIIQLWVYYSVKSYYSVKMFIILIFKFNQENVNNGQ